MMFVACPLADSYPRMELTSSGLSPQTPSSFLEAFERFDSEYRGDGRWDGWESNRSHKYAIAFNDRLYPVKQIISLATGRKTNEFSGGDQANTFVEEHGFDVVSLRLSSIQSSLEEVLASYRELRRSTPFGKTDDDGEKRRMWELFEGIQEELESTSVVSQRPHIQIKWSVGQGNWARVPWIAFLDDRETSTTRGGVYVVYLFKQDMSGVYLTYNQGVSNLRDTYGREVAYSMYKTRAERLRREVPELGDAGFHLDNAIDLSPDGSLGKAYEASTVGYMQYASTDVPEDDVLLGDLGACLQAYDRHVMKKQQMERVQVDRAKLKEAVDAVIRPAIVQRGDLKDGGKESYPHQGTIPTATPKLTPDALESEPRKSVLSALEAGVNLLSGAEQKIPAQDFFHAVSEDDIREEVSRLLYGSASLPERVRSFLEWGKGFEVEDGKRAGLDGTVASYLLALSDPEEYAFCDASHVYKLAVVALLGKEEVRAEWPERIEHAQRFYKTVLEILKDQHDLPLFHLMHVHIAFSIAVSEGDDDARWGEGPVDLGYGKKLDGRAVKVAPGHEAEYWDDCYKSGYVRVGWEGVGDLRQYNNKEDFQAAFDDVYLGSKYDRAKATQKGNELWLLTELRPGDLVVANRGKSEVLAVGEVVEPGYDWKNDLSEYNHVVHVEWDTSYAQEIPKQSYWGMVTVRELPEEVMRHILDRSWPGRGKPQAYEAPPFEKIYEMVQQQGMVIDRRTLRRYHVSLQTRGFVILSGISGTGKTWLTELYAKAVKAKRCPVAVAPNWTTNEDLTGYYNPVNEAYHHTKTSEFLKAAYEAYEKASSQGVRPKPYHLVLDEMNLARVEYYFADFLSKMEACSRGESPTFTIDGEEIPLSPNLYFVGTVNIDETTHAFADKVYDRAQLIEMRAPRERLRSHVGDKPYADMLMHVWDVIHGVAPFAFRVIDEIHAYIDKATDHGSTWEGALDEQLLQKILPKVKGTEGAVGEALRKLTEILDEETYPLSHEKAALMLAKYQQHGFTSYF